MKVDIPWSIVGVGLLVAALSVQSCRLDNAKGDIVMLRAGLKDPETKRPWKDIANETKGELAKCTGSLEGANAVIMHNSEAAEEKAKEDAAKLAAAEKALAAAQRSNRALDKLIDNLKEPIAGADVCARVQSFDNRLTNGLRGLQ